MSDSSEAMRWMVGIDARNLSLGAVAFARWLATGSDNPIYGVHVVEWVPHIPDQEREIRPEDVQRMAADTLRVVADDPNFTEVGAVPSIAAEDGLIEAVKSKQAHALVLGRRAPSSGGGLVRLGRVARRMLRRLPVPVVVVPPDLDANQLGSGPVILAVDMTESCGAAAAFAARVATAMGRDLVLVHAIHAPDRGPYLPADAWDERIAQLDAHGEEQFRQWSDRHAIGAAERVIVHGPPSQRLPHIAAERDACLLVTGSRQLSSVERMFLSSMGSELAAIASVPVAVVPAR